MEADAGANIMKYYYCIDYNELGSPIMRLPKEIELVTIFLLCDVLLPIQEHYISAIDSVLQSKLPCSEIGGNVCRLEIRKDFTRIVDTLAEDKTENDCVIETKELRKLIEVWCRILEEPVKSPKVAI